MGRVYSLIDVETANEVGAYPTEEAALRAVHDAIGRYGRRANAVTSLALLREDAPTEHTCIARGRALARLALSRFGEPESARLRA